MKDSVAENESSFRLWTKKLREASRRNGAKPGGRGSKKRMEDLAKMAVRAGSVVLPGEAEDRFAA